MTPLHPLQSPEWGTFRKKTGLEVVYLKKGFQMTVHPIPKTGWNIGYLPKCGYPDSQVLSGLTTIGREKKCIFIKMEPNIEKKENKPIQTHNYNVRSSPHPLFTNYTFKLDLTKNEDQLLQQMKPKTRYNIRIAQKNGVSVKEQSTKQAFQAYLDLSMQTWKRQRFFGHTTTYHQTMWDTLHPSGIANLLIAEYKGVPITAWIVFLYENILYYPYGASSGKYRNVMASNLMMWEAIRWGKKHGATQFDMWGSLGPNPDPNDPWYGFHKFKEGYGAELVEFVGSYDLVLHPFLYNLYTIVQPMRQAYLRFRGQ